MRQSAFAVVGELAKSCMPQLRQALPQVKGRLLVGAAVIVVDAVVVVAGISHSFIVIIYV